MENYTLTLEEKSRIGIIDSIEDLKFQRELIMAEIPADLGLKLVMAQILAIVTASNFLELDLMRDDLIEIAINDVVRKSNSIHSPDMGAIFRENAIKNMK